MTKLRLLSYAAIYGVVMVLFLFMGYSYNSNSIMLFTGLVISHYVKKKVNLTWFFSALLVIGVILFWLFGFFRVISEDTSIDLILENNQEVVLTEEKAKELETVEQKVNKVPKWIRSLNGESVTGHIVLSKIIEYNR